MKAAEDEVLLNRWEGKEVSLQKVLGTYVDWMKKEMGNFQDRKDCIYFYQYETDSPVSWTVRSEGGLSKLL